MNRPTAGQVLRGCACPFDRRSTLIEGDFREVVRPGAFAKTLRDPRNLHLLVRHDEGFSVGSTRERTLAVEQNEYGLWFELKLGPSTRSVVEEIVAGEIRGCSFKFHAIRERWLQARDCRIREILEAELLEISLADSPAYKATPLWFDRPTAAKPKAKPAASPTVALRTTPYRIPDRVFVPTDRTRAFDRAGAECRG